MARLVRDWGPALAVAVPGAAVMVTGALAFLGWLAGDPDRFVPFRASAAMVASTAIALAAAGLGVLASITPLRGARGVRFACGAIVALIALLAIVEYVFGIETGIDFPALHAGFEHANPWPGRMAPTTALAMLVAGALLLLFDRPSNRYQALAVQLLAGVLLALGIFGIATWDVTATGILPWYRFARMAPTTALACIGLGVAFLALVAQTDWYERIYSARADERIVILTLGILTLVVIGVGATALGIMQRHLESTLGAALNNALDSRVTVLQISFANRVARASIIATRPDVERLVAQASDASRDPGLAARLQEEAASYLGSEFRAVSFLDRNRRVLAAAGKTADEPTLEVPIRGQKNEAALLWDDETFVLRTVEPVKIGGEEVGFVRAEQEIGLLKPLHFNVEDLGITAEWLMCSAVNEREACFPQRFSREPRILSRGHGADAAPIDQALDGKRGFGSALDYQGQRVIAAYGPVGRTGMGVAIELAAEEFYAPLRNELFAWVRWFIAMSLVGALLVASQLRPVTQRLVESEELARRRAAALSRSEAQMRSLYASLADGVIVFATDGTIEFLNPAAARIFGYREEELIGRSVAVLIPGDKLREANRQATQRFVDEGVSELVGKRGLVYPALRRDGSRIDIEFSLAEMRHDAGVRLVGVVRDVSERTALERMKSEFVAAVSHELRTPLTSIIASLDLASEGRLEPAEREFIDMARRNSDRLAKLVNDVIDAARLDSDSLSFNVEPVPVAELLAQTVDLNQPYASAHDVALRLDEPAPAAVLRADRDRLLQVMANLISNAAKFSPPGSEVRVRASESAGRVRIEVIDRGRGIPEEFKPRIFERFAQADASDAREKGGTGLGLPIAKGLVERMGGTIGFDSRVGEGTTFWIEMPAEAASATLR